MQKITRIKHIVNLADKFRQRNPNLSNKFVKIVEVGPRDGLQNQTKILSLNQKAKLINQLSLSGLTTIQVGSFVSPKWIPQMANSTQLFNTIQKHKTVSYPCLVPNQKGMEAAIQAGVKEIAVFASATETFSQKNINCSIRQSLQKFIPVMKMAQKNQIKVRGYVSMVMGCPYQGQVNPQKASFVTEELFKLGCYEVSLGDTVGKGTPQKTMKLMKQMSRFPLQKIAVHFHDTFDQAIENIGVALQMGCRIVDSSIGGLGGCPYSMKPVGNVCTENVAYFLDKAGFETGLNHQKLKETGDWICQILQRKNLSIL